MISYEMCLDAFKSSGLRPIVTSYQDVDRFGPCGCVVGALGAARGIRIEPFWEPPAPGRQGPGQGVAFCRAVAAAYGVSEEYLEGLENGFMGWEPAPTAEALAGFRVGDAVRGALEPGRRGARPPGDSQVA